MSVCVTPIKGTALRVIRLDDCGFPASDTGGEIFPNAQATSDGFVRVDVAPDYAAGSRIPFYNARGHLCVNWRTSSTLLGMDLTIQLCQVDPEVIELMTGSRLIVGEVGGGRGFGVKQGAVQAAYSLELWQESPGTCGGDQFVQHLFPQVEHTTFEDFTVEDGVLSYTLVATTQPNPSYGFGPFEEWNPEIPGDEHYTFQVTATVPPTPACGYGAGLPEDPESLADALLAYKTWNGSEYVWSGTEPTDGFTNIIFVGPNDPVVTTGGRDVAGDIWDRRPPPP